MLTITQYFFIGIAFLLSLFIHQLVIRFTHQSGFFLDEHEKIQKAHSNPTPRIGGLGIFLAALFISTEQELGGLIILSAIPAFIAGFLEDYSGKVSPATRLAIMALSPLMALVMIGSGSWPGLFEGYLPVGVSLLLFAVFMVALINGMNFIDGQNGLASGAAIISFAGLALVAYQFRDSAILFISLILLVATLAFLLFNFPKGKIFLGDGGAYLLGFLLAVLALLLTQRHPGISPLFIPLLAIYPLWEVIFSTFRKLFVDKISPFSSDDFHMHQLVYRNHAAGKGFLPALFILPVQVILLLAAIICIHSTTALLLLLIGYLSVYCFTYFCERKMETRRKAGVAA